MEKTAEHIEHIEHTQHAAHGGQFDRLVAVSMAVIAALLAAVTMLSHRAHNDTLRLQGEANRLESEANIQHTKAADQWAFYQAKNIRRHEYLALANLAKVVPPAAGKEADHARQVQSWQDKAKEYEGDADKPEDANADNEKKSLKVIRKEAEGLEAEAKHQQAEAGERLEKSEHRHHQGDRFDLAELGVELGLVLCSL
ncbi:MAG: DUF4337 family protein, partial [Gemmataceae bacterium]